MQDRHSRAGAGYNGCSCLVAPLVKNPPAMRETWVRFVGWEDPLVKGKATLPTPVFWPEEFHGLYSPWIHTHKYTYSSQIIFFPSRIHCPLKNSFSLSYSLKWCEALSCQPLRHELVLSSVKDEVQPVTLLHPHMTQRPLFSLMF